jgi:hypothetical protein
MERLLSGRPNIVAAWVFASGMEGQIAAGSDLDRGVLIAVPPTVDELVELREKLQRSRQFDDIELVVLNEASPITRYEAVPAGRCTEPRGSGRLRFADGAEV